MAFFSLLLSGCDRPDNQVVPAANEASSASLSVLLEQLTQSDEVFDAPQAPRFPDDYLPHPGMRAESFGIRAILVPGDIQGKPEAKVAAALQTRIERISLRPARSSATLDSQWDFDSVMRFSSMSDAALQNVLPGGSSATLSDNADSLMELGRHAPRQSLQRVALGLAGVEDKRFWVDSDELLITPDADPQKPCQVDYQWSSQISADQRVELMIPVNSCPQAQSIAQLAIWQMDAVAISGKITSGWQGNTWAEMPVTGYAWIDYSWGSPPTGAGAVVFDTLKLRLDNGDVLDVSRSKRSSGSGPSTVSATLFSDGAEKRDISVSWQDEDFQTAASGQQYPRTVLLKNADASLLASVSLMNRLQESSGTGAVVLSAAVLADGEVAGAGFLNYTPIQASP